MLSDFTLWIPKVQHINVMLEAYKFPVFKIIGITFIQWDSEEGYGKKKLQRMK